MQNLDALFNDFLFRISSLSWPDVLDLLLVTLTFFFVFQLVRRSQAASILRGLFILGGLLLAFTLLLPLPAFSTVVQIVALASLIVIPVILQPELRRWLERLGRNQGLFGSSRLSSAEQNVRAILRATEELSAKREGALIILEGRDSLQTYVDGGVSIKGQMTAELLQSIFYGENPLHDGAVIVRDDLVEAAGCVLPLTQSVPVARRRLGTRHRAAVGLSEVSDALSIVVSEETGAISTARFGTLDHGLDSIHLRENILGFYANPSDGLRRGWLAGLRSRRPQERRITARGVLAQIGYLILSLILALLLWGAVSTQQNPIRQASIPGVPLTVLNKPAEWILTSPLPESVTVIIQTDEQTLATVGPQSFQATVDLSAATLGLQRVPVVVETSVEDVGLLGVEPPQVDVNLSESKSETIIVEVVVADPESIPPSYLLVGKPQSTPSEIQVTGPAELVAQVARAEVSLFINGTTASIRTLLPVKAVDEAGVEVNGVTLEPSQVLTTATIRRENNVLDVGVRVVTDGAPPDGYWLSSVSSEPASVTLRGAPADLEAVGSFVSTLPVDLSDVRGEFRMLVPLELPSGVDVIDADGRAITSVTVLIQATPLTGELVLTREVEVQGLRSDELATVDPQSVQVLISGPVPLLNEIEQNPELVQVLVDASSLEPGASVAVIPTIIAPPDATAQLIDQTVVVTREP